MTSLVALSLKQLPVKGLLWLVALLALGWYVGKSELLGNWQPEALVPYLGDNPWQNALVFLGIFSALCAVGLPRQIPAFLGGFHFGLWQGVVLSTLAVTIAAWITLMVARFLGRQWFKDHLQRRQSRLRSFLSHNTFRATLAVRLFPIGHNLGVNILAGIAGLPKRKFLMGSFVGYLPQMVVFALAGTGLQLDTSWQIVLGMLLMLVSSSLGWALYRRSQAKMERAASAQSAVEKSHAQ
ncbi:VTT domain-containing protein [Aliiglaciecola sp. CAU 1673]|uniref:TVP38/TMEM64 family protein n=1 Tax=Aliiglaciecola sp. CAU 1673 TaxID=3032595 RepID=UPI0023D9FBCC|nr:VTT domain-containing protein [Aliiglaciecola sp. CAU 1673]MDF2177278.1 VTT domain-containing protein [Aliiglaciecola sp. CAU 1673]